MIARVSDLRLDPAQIDDGVRRVHEDLVPALGRVPGVERARWMVSPDTGDVLAITGWVDEESMYAAASALAAVRDEVVGELHATPRAAQIHDLQHVEQRSVPPGDSEHWTRVHRLQRLGDPAGDDIRELLLAAVGELEPAEGYVSDWWSVDTLGGNGLRMTSWSTPEQARKADADEDMRRRIEEFGWTVSSVDVFLTVEACFAGEALDGAGQASSSTS